MFTLKQTQREKGRVMMTTNHDMEVRSHPHIPIPGSGSSPVSATKCHEMSYPWSWRTWIQTSHGGWWILLSVNTDRTHVRSTFTILMTSIGVNLHNNCPVIDWVQTILNVLHHNCLKEFSKLHFQTLFQSNNPNLWLTMRCYASININVNFQLPTKIWCSGLCLF